eukprot:TRINITY_DN12143_c0_g1_i1.p1 TRINITY_DN12143_c0_g1~~TRINITY_DN12143_c0_g1_i1.p1  ORF type:complete len:321 (+),score=63.57 TRINITY_DN12143_c0_g1_i1:47-1009(+)
MLASTSRVFAASLHSATRCSPLVLSLRAAHSFSLTDAQRSEHQRNLSEQGFTLFPNFVAPEDVEGLRSRAHSLVTAFEPSQISVFSTKNQEATTDDYFMNSGDDVRMFFEENVFGEGGELLVDKNKAINKIGHALHEKDEVFRKFAQQKALTEVIGSVIGIQHASLVQSMYIFKQPKIGGEVSPHIDSTFLYTDPPSCHALWFALEDAHVNNGCLWVSPGSHTMPIRRRFVRTGKGLEVGMEQSGQEEEKWDLDSFVPVEVPSGTLVIMHGQLAHLSHPNTSAASRHAFTLHVVDQRAEWSPRNWLQRSPDNPFPSVHAS